MTAWEPTHRSKIDGSAAAVLYVVMQNEDGGVWTDYLEDWEPIGPCPAGGEHIWTDDVGPEHEHLRGEHRWHCDNCGATQPREESAP